MYDGFMKVASASPMVHLGNPRENAISITSAMKKAHDMGVKAIVFPELSITGYTLSDLFFQERLLEEAEKALGSIIEASKNLKEMVSFVGLPLRAMGKLYNTAAVVNEGRLVALIPKVHIPNYLEYYESRYFESARGENIVIKTRFGEVPFGVKYLFEAPLWNAVLSLEICEDLWVPESSSVKAAMAGANLIFNLSASDEVVEKEEKRERMIRDVSERLSVGYVYADASEGESTTDMVFASNLIIAENGEILGSSIFSADEIITRDIDIALLNETRARRTTFTHEDDGYTRLQINLGEPDDSALERVFRRSAFIPDGKEDLERICHRASMIQAIGLKRRIISSGAKKLVIGLSGGLDSTLALLSSAKALDLLSRPHSDLIAVSMPCFGTTGRTKGNAERLAHAIGAELRVIDIKETVNSHFRDIGHDENKLDTVYENAQARERTRILMDIANAEGGLVVGTGDLSELALGWATYNGDHMSNYGINAGIPKTMVRFLVTWYMEHSDDRELKDVLEDILNKPVSPELLPPSQGEISQETEKLVGPYELHDFFLYHFVNHGWPPRKIRRIAEIAFKGKYSADEIRTWLRVFIKRFFSQQFKRSALPDGPKVVSVSLSPRSDWRMPSDAEVDLWLEDV